MNSYSFCRAIALLLLLCAISHAGDSRHLIAKNTGVIAYRLDESNYRQLLNLLNSDENRPRVPDQFFGKLYNRELVDVVAYFDNTGVANIQLSKGYEARVKLFGDQIVYVLVFQSVILKPAVPATEVKNGQPDKIATTQTVTKGKRGGDDIDEEAVTYSIAPPKKPEPITTEGSFSLLQSVMGSGEATAGGLIRALATALKLTPAAGETGKLPKDSSLTFKFRPITCSCGEDTSV